MLEQFKALGSETRLRILGWLKDPQSHFPPSEHASEEAGVCVGRIQRKAALSASSASTHLAILQRAGLVQATRIGQWTYYRRNEESIRKLAAEMLLRL